MNSKQVIRLSLLSSLLIVLNGCGDGSSNKEEQSLAQSEQEVNNEEQPLTQNEQEVNREDAKNVPVITLNGDSQVTIIQGASYKELGATAVDSDGKPLEVSMSGSVDNTTPGSYTSW